MGSSVFLTHIRMFIESPRNGALYFSAIVTKKESLLYVLFLTVENKGNTSKTNTQNTGNTIERKFRRVQETRWIKKKVQD